MPRIGCVDDELEWVNVAICLEVVFQDSYFTISVYTPRDQEQLYPSTSARRGTPRSSSVDSACSVVTPEEMLVSEHVGGHISWTRSDSDLAYGQRMDRSMGLLFREMVRRGIRIDGTLEDLGPNPIPLRSSIRMELSRSVRTLEQLGPASAGKPSPLSKMET